MQALQRSAAAFSCGSAAGSSRRRCVVARAEAIEIPSGFKKVSPRRAAAFDRRRWAGPAAPGAPLSPASMALGVEGTPEKVLAAACLEWAQARATAAAKQRSASPPLPLHVASGRRTARR